jgi:hypothetical protein
MRQGNIQSNKNKNRRIMTLNRDCRPGKILEAGK